MSFDLGPLETKFRTRLMKRPKKSSAESILTKSTLSSTLLKSRKRFFMGRVKVLSKRFGSRRVFLCPFWSFHKLMPKTRNYNSLGMFINYHITITIRVEVFGWIFVRNAVNAVNFWKKYCYCGECGEKKYFTPFYLISYKYHRINFCGKWM